MRRVFSLLALLAITACSGTPPPDGEGGAPFTATSISGRVPGWGGERWVHATANATSCVSDSDGVVTCSRDVYLSTEIGHDGSFTFELPGAPPFAEPAHGCPDAAVDTALLMVFSSSDAASPETTADFVSTFVLAAGDYGAGGYASAWIYASDAFEGSGHCPGPPPVDYDLDLVHGWNVVHGEPGRFGGEHTLVSGPAEGAEWQSAD